MSAGDSAFAEMIHKIIDLEDKEERLRLLTANLDRDQKHNLFQQEQSKKTLKQMLLQLDHERNLKLDAFERVEELQRTIIDLEDKEERLRLLTANLDRDQKHNLFQQEQSKKTLKQMLLQLDHERNLKLDAFERVEELQRTIYEYEQQIGGCLSRPVSGSLEKRPFTSWLPVADAAPLPQRSASVMSNKPSTGTNRHPGGKVWPTSSTFQSRSVTSPDFVSSITTQPKIQRPKTLRPRLRERIADTLLGDLETEQQERKRVPHL
ncbi:Coiled-coil domain-containing protein 162 [Exaiptasia diaphana]|nr:Coiled-coil domain-containing protein 162 [Exaiptasia diaphana]